jgi:hypothetical protein
MVEREFCRQYEVAFAQDLPDHAKELIEKAILRRESKGNISEAYPKRRELFCSQCEHYCTGCVDKCKEVNSAVSQLDACPVGKWEKEVKQKVITVNAMLPNNVVNSPIGEHIRAEVEKHGIILTDNGVKDKYKLHLTSCRNAITWGMKLPHKMYAANNRNMLYIENGLLNQKKGVFVDHKGFFADSWFCQSRAWETEPSPEERRRMREMIQDRHGWEFNAGGDPNGPVLVALQTKRDASLLYYYPAAEKQQLKNFATLQFVNQHLQTDKDVIIRKHPLFNDFNPRRYNQLFKSNWSWDETEKLSDILPKCSAVVTTNSTVAIDALTLGLPVATLGDHVWTRSGVTFECSTNPERLAQFENHKSDVAKIESFICALIRSELPFNCKYEDVAESYPFQQWLERTTGQHVKGIKPTRSEESAAFEKVSFPGTRELSVPYQRMLKYAHHKIVKELDSGKRDSVTIGLVGMAHLGDTLCSSTLPRKIKERFGYHIKVFVVDHKSTKRVFENNPYVDGFSKTNPIHLGLNKLPRVAYQFHHLQRVETFLDCYTDEMPKPEIYLSEDEKEWAQSIKAKHNKPIIVLSVRHVTGGTTSPYESWPFEKWIDQLHDEYTVIQPVISKEKYLQQANIHPRDANWKPERIYTDHVLEDLETRQYLALFSIAVGHTGVLSGGAFAAQAFDVPVLLGCPEDFNHGQRSTWVFPNQRIFAHVRD